MQTSFDVSVPMSSYLLALIVSDFTCKYTNVTGMGDYGSVKVGVCSLFIVFIKFYLLSYFYYSYMRKIFNLCR